MNFKVKPISMVAYFSPAKLVSQVPAENMWKDIHDPCPPGHYVLDGKMALDEQFLISLQSDDCRWKTQRAREHVTGIPGLA